MARVKRGFKARRRRNRVLKQTEGFWGGRKNRFRQAIEVLHKAWAYAYVGRKQRKREMRRLWISRINAAARLQGTTYGRLIHGLKQADIALDRKVLSDIAIHDPAGFGAVVTAATKTAAGASKKVASNTRAAAAKAAAAKAAATKAAATKAAATKK